MQHYEPRNAPVKGRFKAEGLVSHLRLYDGDSSQSGQVHYPPIRINESSPIATAQKGHHWLGEFQNKNRPQAPALTTTVNRAQIGCRKAWADQFSRAGISHKGILTAKLQVRESIEYRGLTGESNPLDQRERVGLSVKDFMTKEQKLFKITHAWIENPARIERVAVQVGATRILEQVRRCAKLVKFNGLLGLKDGQWADEIYRKEPERVRAALAEIDWR